MVLLSFYIFSLLLITFVRKANLSWVYCIIVTCISVLSFFYAPNDSADLSRHFDSIMQFGDMGLDWVLENKCDINPLTSLLFYAFSFFGEPRLFASFSVFVTYSFIFLLLHRVTQHYFLTKPEVTVLATFLLFNWNYLLIVSNCRIFMLYAVVIYFFYMEFIEDTYHRTAFLVYVASLFFHYGILLVLIPRFLLYLYKPKRKSTYIIAAIVLSLLGYVCVSSYQSIFLDSLMEKVEGYKNYKVFGLLQYVNSLFCIVICGFYLLYKHKIVRYCNIRYFIVSCLLFLLILFQITNYQVIYRESNLVASLSIVLFAQMFVTEKNENLKTIIYLQSGICFLYYVMFVYKFIDFKYVV